MKVAICFFRERDRALQAFVEDVEHDAGCLKILRNADLAKVFDCGWWICAVFNWIPSFLYVNGCDDGNVNDYIIGISKSSLIQFVLYIIEMKIVDTKNEPRNWLIK